MTEIPLTDLQAMFDNRYQQKNSNSDVKKLTHQELSELIPTNFSECPGGDCNHQVLRSNKFTDKLWECPNCKANANPDHTHTCLTCGREIGEDDRNESEVELE